MNVIRLQEITRSNHQISITYSFKSYRFEVAIWYDSVDLIDLENRYGKDKLDRIYFHIAAFEFNKLVSLKPDKVDFGDYKVYCDENFFNLWHSIQFKVWAQWRYENDLPKYKGPKLAHDFATVSKHELIDNLLSNQAQILSFCGGGKDSLVAASLFEKLKIPYASFVYSNSIYGQSRDQHKMVNKLLSGLHPTKIHRQYVYDSFIDCPILEIDKTIKSKLLLAAETPSSIFASLPVVLANGYRYIALAHERSANTGNLIWDETQEEINHQWGKSYEVEQLLNQYIKENLIADFSYFSILQPIYDVVIFNILRSVDSALIKQAHSCNINKPWCKKCPKCAYVWLNYMAYLPVDLVNKIFDNDNLFDFEENYLWFRQMLGLEEHTPFECIGQIEEK